MAAFHQLFNMKMNWRNACNGFSGPIRGRFEGTSDPEAGLPLHFPEIVERSRHVGPLVHPESASIGGYGEYAGSVKHSLVFGPEPTDRVA